ncbi:EAL domain-containing protein [Paenarthrobacter sp. NPDC092416]|uniref:EAL domain-containing protein n=1 Tax=Paenarthrobacter sp. NPDC092416 TaxID=3364386 RepID=UPI0038152E9D
MSHDGLSFSAAGGSRRPVEDDARASPFQAVDEMAIRQQAREIIDEILADVDAKSEWALKALRKLVESHPDDPKRALLEHLIETRKVTDALEQAPAHQESMSLNRETSEAPQTVTVPVDADVRKRIQTVLRDKLLLTAFQPIHALPGGDVIGVEALIRFVEQDGAAADVWFREASDAGLGTELEIAALHCALAAAEDIPANLFVAFNLTPATAQDPRVRKLLSEPYLPPERIVVELTGSLKAAGGLSKERGLGPLRSRGLRLAISASGAGLVSMDRVEELSPDIVKLDRYLIEGIEGSEGQRTRAKAIVEVANQIGADVVAEGIETLEELREATALNVTAAQGYLLGRPSVDPLEWSSWTIHSSAEPQPAG